MKIVARLLTLILVICMVAIPFASCKSEKSVKGYCTVVVASDPVAEYKVNLDKVTVTEGLISVLDYLAENDDSFSYTASESSYGKFITVVNSLDSSAVTNGFITLLTSVEKDFDVSEYAVTKDYNGTKIVTSGLGASSMTIEANAIYYIALSSY